eukprot:TRINITY_DN2883_c1_g1_i1.p1 TRINITY_DN2883_c1_g1~~TRINITY_DN2883_c1_g1_i1.p1  ORF type:complete len:136 (-),score=24.05 TRINITY_DN2883_c1_g1_i1:46-453(-)
MIKETSTQKQKNPSMHLFVFLFVLVASALAFPVKDQGRVRLLPTIPTCAPSDIETTKRGNFYEMMMACADHCGLEVSPYCIATCSKELGLSEGCAHLWLSHAECVSALCADSCYKTDNAEACASCTQKECSVEQQ